MRSRAGFRAFFRRHRVTVASWTALAVVSSVLVAYAVNADGYPVHKAELNDGGIWVTNQSMGAVGRQNVPVAQIDGRVFDGTEFTALSGLDVLQDGSAVLSVDRGAHTLMPIDVSMAIGRDAEKVTGGGDTPLFGGGSLGVLDAATGKLWATVVDPEAGVGSLAEVAGSAKPLTKVGGDAVGTAGRNGTIYAASTDEGEVVRLRPAANGAGFEEPTTDPIDADHDGELEAMTAVGDVPVMLDDKGNLLTTSETLGNVGAGSKLQQAGPHGEEVLVATPESLVAVAVDGGTRREIAEVGAQTWTAAPVRMSNGCAFAAWGSGKTGTLVSACGDAEAETHTFEIGTGAELVFRINRNQVVLNDQKTGTTWTVTTSEPEKISNWEAFRQETSTKDDKDSNKSEAKTTQPPKAEDDELGARGGRTTTLNVLDNDLIASDGILSIVGVKGVSRDEVQVRIAPDRQTLLATVKPGATGTASFRYTIDDGTAKKTSQADGRVTLKLRDDSGSGKPELRKNAKQRTFPVAAGGVVEFAVTPDWRDYDYGDPIVVDSAKSGGAEVSTTALGLIRVEAPAGSKGGLRTVDYTVTTGSGSVPGKVKVQVVPAGTSTVKPQAEADVVAGVTGGPITVKPLDNDVPGADGSDASARLSLAGRVAPTGGLTVDTDLESGRIVVTGSKPGTYLLDYNAGFGAAPRAPGKIRIDISAPASDSDRPVATPDNTAIHGLSPVTVDVLANDFDPRGRMLVVQNAKPSIPDSQLEVAVIDGRWVRVNAIDGNMTPRSQSVTYTISNGEATAEGSINVTQRDALDSKENQPVTQSDRVTVRAGDTVAAPVLDNDATPSGDPVGLMIDASITPVGELRVLPEGDNGTAYVSGRQVRFVAPENVTGPTDVEVPYVAVNTGDPSAETAIGTLKVHITPLPSKTNPNQTPTPRTLEGRVTQGDLVTLKLPPVGSDPDGDSVAVTGVATAPKLGRILAFGANSLSYQAYPDAEGTDEFTYEVTDQFGDAAIGHVRVGVVPAGEPQAPLAINDNWIADPDRTVDVDALGNDLRTPGTRVEILPLEDDGADVKLQSDQGPVSVDAPADMKSRSVPYTISNGLAESRGVVTITGEDGYNNPPVTQDLFASPKAGSGTVEVDVLAAVFDVDGPEDKLELDAVTGLAPTDGSAGVTLKGGKAVIPVKDVAQVLAYRVLDDEGAAAAAAIYVPARPTGAPYLKPDAKIELKPGETRDVDLSELVEDPEDDKVVLTTVDALDASPTERLKVTADDEDTLTVKATKSEGPGAIVFEVSDRAKLTDPDAHTAYISVPVHVGEEKPVINCPSTPIDVPEGGVSKSIDVASVCHVWTADPTKARDLEFSASWKEQPTGVDVSTEGGRVQLIADGDARRGDTGVVSLAADGFDATGELLVRVIALPAPKLAPIRLDTEAGKSVSVDVNQYLSSPLPSSSREVKIMEVDALGGASAEHKIDGSKLTFTPKPDTDGTMRYRLEVSDVGGSTSSARPRATSEATLAVVARPDAPKGLVAGQEMLANTVALNWQTPDNNGKRIDGYEVKYSGAGDGTFRCSGTPCRVTGLRNGDPYTFQVRAHNATQQNGGWSEWSNSAQATPDALTGPPLNPEVVLQRDSAMTVRWAPPAPCDCSDVQVYRLTWPGGARDVSAGTRESVIPAANGDNVTVTIKALNKKGLQTNNGASTSVTGTGAGKPAAPGAPSLTPTNRPGNDRKGIQIDWAPVGPNGPGPVSYEVQRRSGSGTTVVCQWTTATTCADEVTNDGTSYTYEVRAKNGEADSPRETTDAGKALHISDHGAGTSIEASAPPDAPRITSLTPTGSNGSARMTFDVGPSHGATNSVTCRSSAGACGTWTFGRGGAANQQHTITGLPNGSTSTVTLTACNGGSANICVDSNTASVVTYGPIGERNGGAVEVSINATPDSPSVGDRTTNWSISVDPNGAPVHWEVRRNGGVVAQGNSGNGPFNQSGGETLAYDTTYTYNLVVTDASGHGRAAKNASDTARTGRLDPTVTVSKGSPSCGDATGRTCGGTAIVHCSGTCWPIVIHTRDFPSGVSCRWYGTDGHEIIPGSTKSLGANDDQQVSWWAGDPNSFYVGCSGGGVSDRSPDAW